MNLEKGFRKIALLVGLIAAGCCAALAVMGVNILHNEAEDYLRRCRSDHREEYNPLHLFKLVPDDGGEVLYECMDIEEVRQQWPSYNDMNDLEFTTRIHKAFYQHVPFDKFVRAFGLPELPAGKSYRPLELDVPSKTLWLRELSDERLRNLENGFWVNVSTAELVGLCAMSGVAAGGIGCLAVWLIYKLLRWLVLGFVSASSEVREQQDSPEQKGAIAMNRKQKRIMWVGFVIIVLMGLFPPTLKATWRGLLGLGDSPQSYYYKFDGYGFLFSSSGPIDIARLSVQWVVVVIISGGLVVALRDKKARQDGSEPHLD